MKIELKYFSGTGNSLKIQNTCREVFESNHQKGGETTGWNRYLEPIFKPPKNHTNHISNKLNHEDN
jgi:hypothetical protein